MILTTALMAALLAPAPISFSDGILTIVDAGTTEKIRVAEIIPGLPQGMEKQAWNMPTCTVAFGKSGLWIKKGNWQATSTLASVPTSTMLFSTQQIAENKRLATTGQRSLAVSALSGSVVMGDKLYLWLRWNDKNGKSYLEGLFLLDTKPARPASQFIGKMPGGAYGSGRVNDRLKLDGDTLFAPVKAQDGWGVGVFNLKSQEVSFRKVGELADDAYIIPQTKSIAAVRATTYQSTIVSMVNGPSDSQVDAVEVRGKVVSIQSPGLVCWLQGSTPVLMQTLTGAKVAIPAGSGYRPTRRGVIVWTPKDKPTSATLYDNSFRQLAKWTPNSPAGQN